MWKGRTSGGEQKGEVLDRENELSNSAKEVDDRARVGDHDALLEVCLDGPLEGEENQGLPFLTSHRRFHVTIDQDGCGLDPPEDERPEILFPVVVQAKERKKREYKFGKPGRACGSLEYLDEISVHL